MSALPEPSAAESVYERDFHEWSLRMAQALRDHNAAALDWNNLAEELEGLAGRDRRELFSRIKVLVMHLLKWKAQPLDRSRSWMNTIRTQRDEIELLLEQSPSLRRFVDEAIERGYPRAAELAVEEMGLLQNPFPEKCPFTAEQVLSTGYLPG